MQITGQSIIGYRRGDTNGAELHGFNPRTGESIEPAFHSASGADLDHAVGLGSESFSTYGWLTAKKRASFLRQIAENLEGLGEELIERAVAETALTAARIRSERGRTCFQLRFFG